MKKLNLFFLLLISVFSYQSYLGQNVPVSTCSTNVDNFSYSVMRSSTTANDKQRMAFIIPASQLTGLTGGTITSTFFRRPTASGSLGAGTTFKIYLKNTSAVDFGSAAIDWATETGTAVMVYNADPQAAVGSTAGDKKFEHSTNFVYTAGSNIAVYTEYVQTAAQATNIYWQYEYSSPCINTSNSNTTKYVNTTSAFGATLTSTNYRRPVIGFDATFPPAVAAPACTTMSSPASNATGVSVNPTFTWAPVTGQNAATSYLINLGTTPGGTNVMNGVDVGNVTTYTLPSATTLNFSQQYYVTIIPKNSIGNATGCTERSFTTGNVACPPVTSPASAAVGVLTTPTITWTASSGATGYKITMGTTSGGSDILNNVDVGNVTTYTLANALNNSTIYYYTVNAYSGTNNSASCTVRSFTTVCTAENAPTATQVFSTYLPACWTAAKGTVATSSTLTYGTSKWASESGFANTGTNAGVRINLYDANPGDWLISQEINLGSTPGLYRVKYKMAVTSYLGTTAQTTLGSHLVRLIVSTDGGATWSNTNVIKTYTGAAAYSSTGQTETVNLTAYSGSVKVAFVATTTSTTPDIDFHIDDFVVEAIPSCEAPTAITSSLVTTSSATISWTAPATVPANGYEYYYSTSNTAPTAATAASGTSTAATAPLSGLASATTYYVWVRSVCSTSSSSVWSTSGTFTTLCNATGVPYTLDFTSVTTPALPTCTSAVNSGSGNTWVTYSPGATGFTGNVLNYTFNSTNAANTWFFTQGINLTAGTAYRIQYKYGNNGGTTYPEKLKVAYGTSATSASMTNQLVDNGNITNTTAATAFADFTPATTGVYYFGFQAYSNADMNRLYVDDINIDVAPSCSEPTALVVSNVTTTAANLAWTAPATAPANGYEVYYSTTSTAPIATTTPTLTVTTTSTPLSPLAIGTTYYVWVRSNCGATKSVWTPVVSFTTLIPAPANDNCSAPITITPGATFAQNPLTGTTVGSTNTPALTATCLATPTNVGGNVWYTVVVPASGSLTIETAAVTGSPLTDTVVSVFASCSSTTSIGCDDDSGTDAFSKLTLTGQTPGTTLYISVWKYSTATDGQFQISAYDASLATSETVQVKNDLKIYPNPFADVLNISDVKNVKSVNIVDIAGRLVKTIDKPSSALQLRDLNSGMYMVILNMNDGSKQTIKAIKK